MSVQGTPTTTVCGATPTGYRATLGYVARQESVHARVTQEEKERFAAAAFRAGMTLSEWIVRACEQSYELVYGKPTDRA